LLTRRSFIRSPRTILNNAGGQKLF
jgi:hypothetical protein